MPLWVTNTIEYDSQTAGETNAINSTTVKMKTNYRTITFLEPPTGELLAWLQANATKGASLDPVSEWSVSDISGATYKFALNSNGYYESNNKGVNNSAAVCRVNIHAAKACTVTFKCINYADTRNRTTTTVCLALSTRSRTPDTRIRAQTCRRALRVRLSRACRRMRTRMLRRATTL